MRSPCVEVGGKTKFTCVDGPEFDAHQVNWPLMFTLMSAYRDKEGRAYSAHKEDEHGETAKAVGRTPMPEQDPKERAKNFDDVALGYTRDMAVAEAARWLAG